MIDSYEIVLYSFKNGISSQKTLAYKLKEVATECNRILNEYQNTDGESLKMTVRDRIRESVIFTLDLSDLNALKQNNEFVDIKRFISNAVDAYYLNPCVDFETMRGAF